MLSNFLHNIINYFYDWDSQLIEAIRNRNLERVLYFLDGRANPAFKNNYPIRVASSLGYNNIIKILLNDNRVDPAAKNNGAIREASQNGHSETVKVLLTDHRVDPAANDNEAIILASRNGHSETVKVLLTDHRVDPAANDNEAIMQASGNGHSETVKVLLTDHRVDPAADDNWAIRWACLNSHFETVKILLSDNRVDPSAYNNGAFRMAIFRGHKDIIKILLADRRISPDIKNGYKIITAIENKKMHTVRQLANQNTFDFDMVHSYIIQNHEDCHDLELMRVIITNDKFKSMLTDDRFRHSGIELLMAINYFNGNYYKYNELVYKPFKKHVDDLTSVLPLGKQITYSVIHNFMRAKEHKKVTAMVSLLKKIGITPTQKLLDISLDTPTSSEAIDMTTNYLGQLSQFYLNQVKVLVLNTFLKENSTLVDETVIKPLVDKLFSNELPEISEGFAELRRLFPEQSILKSYQTDFDMKIFAFSKVMHHIDQQYSLELLGVHGYPPKPFGSSLRGYRGILTSAKPEDTRKQIEMWFKHGYQAKSSFELFENQFLNYYVDMPTANYRRGGTYVSTLFSTALRYTNHDNGSIVLEFELLKGDPMICGPHIRNDEVVPSIIPGQQLKAVYIYENDAVKVIKNPYVNFSNDELKGIEARKTFMEDKFDFTRSDDNHFESSDEVISQLCANELAEKDKFKELDSMKALRDGVNEVYHHYQSNLPLMKDKATSNLTPEDDTSCGDTSDDTLCELALTTSSSNTKSKVNHYYDVLKYFAKLHKEPLEKDLSNGGSHDFLPQYQNQAVSPATDFYSAITWPNLDQYPVCEVLPKLT